MELSGRYGYNAPVPLFRSHRALELVRGLKAFSNFEIGLTRGQVRDSGRLEAQVRDLSQKLERTREQLKARGEQLKRARQQITDKNNRITELQNEVNAGSALLPEKSNPVVDRFHRLYYDSGSLGGTWLNTFWLGVPTLKCPFDLWIYQEIVFDRKPDVIIETGTASGGSALFLASMCDLLERGRIITVDIEDKPGRPQHQRIQYIRGSSTSEEIVAGVRESLPEDGRVLVILDSDHSKAHVLAELRAYSRLVREGDYIIAEDTNLNGHPVRPDFGPGPMEAVQEFLQENEDFVIDESKEKFYMTFNPRGYLKRLR